MLQEDFNFDPEFRSFMPYSRSRIFTCLLTAYGLEQSFQIILHQPLNKLLSEISIFHLFIKTNLSIRMEDDVLT